MKKKVVERNVGKGGRAHAIFFSVVALLVIFGYVFIDALEMTGYVVIILPLACIIYFSVYLVFVQKKFSDPILLKKKGYTLRR